MTGRLTDLRALADRATEGPWRSSGPTIWAPANPDDPTDFSGEAVAYVPTLADEFDHEDAAYIAAFDPSTARLLLDVAQAGKRLLRDGGNHTNYEDCIDDWPGRTDYPDSTCPACSAVHALRAALERLEAAE